MKEELLQYLIEEILEEEDMDLTPEDNLLAMGLVDSMGIVKYIGWISEHFAIEIPPQEMTIENFMSIEAIERYIKSKK
jgi:acyl carrier protein